MIGTIFQILENARLTVFHKSLKINRPHIGIALEIHVPDYQIQTFPTKSFFNPNFLKMKTISTKALNVVSKALAITTLAFCLTNTAKSQVCSTSGVIYALSNAGTIYPVTVSNASVSAAVNPTSLGTTNSANAIGYNTVNGLFYYFQNANSGASQQFVSFNPTTGVYTTLAAAPITATAFKGCVNFNGTGYYCIDANGNLCYYNIASNTWTLLCSTFTDQYGNNVSSILKSQSSGDIAIDGLGNLWIVSSSSSTWGLYKISAPLPTTNVASMTAAQMVDPSTATPTGANFAGIAFDPSGNIYMGTTGTLYLLQTNYTLTKIGSFSVGGVCGDLTSCSYPYAILPVSWESFSVTSQDNKSVAVSWSVSQQVNNSGYYVEHSIDGANWDKLGFVAGKGSNGQTVQYSFSDNSPADGQNYYRICQVDLDGKENYSEIKTVNINNSSNTVLNIWPNPARDAIKIQNNSSYTIARIYSQSGSLVNETRLQAGTNTINVSSLTFGAYIVNVKDANGANYNQKFIKE